MNASVISLSEARALVASPLWPRIRTFLWEYASLVDESRLDKTGLGRGRSSPRVRAWILQTLGVTPVFHDFPATDASRLLLLSREDYDRLAQFLGVVALTPALRLITLGADVRALKSAFPNYREILPFSAYFHRFATLFERFAPGSETPSPVAVEVAGYGILAAALSALPSPLILRQRLRFPVGSPADDALSKVSTPSEVQGSAEQAARLALKLSNPQEYSLCFS